MITVSLFRAGALGASPGFCTCSSGLTDCTGEINNKMRGAMAGFPKQEVGPACSGGLLRRFMIFMSYTLRNLRVPGVNCTESVYSFRVPQNKWTKLPPCKYAYFSMAVVKDQLTTIGGEDDKQTTNSLVSYSGKRWEEVLSPMPTRRKSPAAATTPTHLVVAGGRSKQDLFGSNLSIVEVLNTKTRQWSRANDVPKTLAYPHISICDGSIYLSNGTGSTFFTCSVREILDSCKPTSSKSTDDGSVWSRLADIPVSKASLITLKSRVLVIGGCSDDTPTGAIHCYDLAINSWSATDEMPTPLWGVLAAVLPSNELVVVGGNSTMSNSTAGTAIGTMQL